MKGIVAVFAVTLSTVVHGGITGELPVCVDRTSFEQASLARDTDDSRGMGYLIERKRCLTLPAGLEYSLIGVNPMKDPRDWAQIRIYTDDGPIELFSWYGFVY